MSSLNTTKIRLISLDLDDTLLKRDKTISDETIKILQRLQKQGMILVLNSGRFYHEIEPYAKQLNLYHNGGYAISANGHTIHNLFTQDRYEFPSITSQDSTLFLRYAKQHHLMCYFHDQINYHVYATLWYRNMFRSAQRIAQALKPILPYFPKSLFAWDPQPYPKQIQVPLEKLCFIGLPQHLEKLSTYVETQKQEYHTFPVNIFSKEIVHHSVSKRNAIAHVCAKHHLTMDQVLAFGDAGNDLPLLKDAGIGYTMKNAHATILKQATHITKYTNEEDGVAQTLAELFF